MGDIAVRFGTAQGRHLAACLGAALFSLLPSAQAQETAPAYAELPGIHPFFALRTSIIPGGVIMDKPNQGSLTVESPSGQQFASISAGADWGRYWGFEFNIDRFESDIGSPQYGKLADYDIWTGMANMRFRYPIPELRLQPYAILGAGISLAETNDRNVLNAGIPFGSSLSTSPVVGIGAGVEYFLADNVAFGLEVKHRAFARSTVQFQGGNERLNLDSTAFSLGLRMYLDGGPGVVDPPVPTPKAADSDEMRGYLALRTGAGFVPDGSTDIGVSAQNSGTWLGSFAVGANFNKYWGLEFAADYTPGSDLEAAPYGAVAKYAYWTMLGQARLRYPVMNDRLSPYVLLGGGIGMAEVNKRKISVSQYPLSGGTSTVPVGAVGAGFDYFIAENMSVGLEAKHIVPFRPEISVNGQTSKVDLDPVYLTVGVRLYFP
jgi:opacity protein-like surface antigen